MYMEKQYEKRNVGKTEKLSEPDMTYAQDMPQPNVKSHIRIPNWEGRTEPYTVEELHQGIRNAEADVAAGRVIPANEFIGKMRKRYRL